jgi:hypothetical protein
MAAIKVLVNYDFGKNQIQNAVVHTLASAPSSPSLGQLYFDTAADRLYIKSAGSFNLKATDSDLLTGQNGAYYLARANFTGTQLAATISDLATTVQGYRLDQFAVPTTTVSFNNQRAVLLADPTGPQDAATMAWVQTQLSNAAAGIDAKASVRVATTANITLSGTQTIDGVAVIAGDRVLVKNQTTTTQNGVYIVAAGAWTRATDADATGELTPGAFWYVEEGSANLKTQWRIENTGTITLGSTAITINQFGGAAASYTFGNGLNLTGSNVTVVGDTGITVSASGVAINTAVVPRKYSANIGDGSSTTVTVTHNLNTTDVIVQIKDSSGNVVIADVNTATVNTVTVTFNAAPASNAYRATVLG